jgi:hypothetical protein
MATPVGTHFTGPVVSANGFSGNAVADASGGGITDGTGTVISTDISKVGKVINTQIFIDITGLGSSTTDLDIIGTGINPAYIAAVSNAESGQIYALTMTCLELPVTGVVDIDLYAAVEDTGAFDGGIGALDETALVTSGGDWVLNTTATATGWPTDGLYLYLCNGAGSVVGTFTAGQFLIDMWGYEA